MTGLLFLLVDPFPQLYGFRKIPQVWGWRQTDYFGCWCCRDLRCLV